MWARVDDRVERKVKTEGMEAGTRAVLGVCTRRGCRDGRARRETMRDAVCGGSGVGFNPEARLRGDGIAGKGCIDVHQMCGDGTAVRQDGGEVVWAQQQGSVGLQERDTGIVWWGSTRRWVRTDGAEVEAGLDERVAAEGTPVWREYGCGRWAQPRDKCETRWVCPHAGGCTEAGSAGGGLRWRRDGMGGAMHRRVARQRCSAETGVRSSGKLNAGWERGGRRKGRGRGEAAGVVCVRGRWRAAGTGVHEEGRGYGEEALGEGGWWWEVGTRVRDVHYGGGCGQRVQRRGGNGGSDAEQSWGRTSCLHGGGCDYGRRRGTRAVWTWGGTGVQRDRTGFVVAGTGGVLSPKRSWMVGGGAGRGGATVGGLGWRWGAGTQAERWAGDGKSGSGRRRGCGMGTGRDAPVEWRQQQSGTGTGRAWRCRRGRGRRGGDADKVVGKGAAWEWRGRQAGRGSLRAACRAGERASPRQRWWARQTKADAGAQPLDPRAKVGAGVETKEGGIGVVGFGRLHRVTNGSWESFFLKIDSAPFDIPLKETQFRQVSPRLG
ncbi:hypothetical protein B0H19DRAFT_1286338 [Mycena capillaripes]|nr:hypothetical protein B0H19DRAFT_1286338 [Mycena capillaripes]